MKYYYDTEFIEGKQKNKFPFSVFKKETKPTIDLISIAIVSEDNREYTAISKDFNLRESWNRYDLVKLENPLSGITHEKVYWIRENVLKPIWLELSNIYFFECVYEMIDIQNGMTYESLKALIKKCVYEMIDIQNGMTYESLKALIKKYGKTNEQIAKEVFEFVNPDLGFPIESYNNSDLRIGSKLAEHFDLHNVDEFEGCYCAKPEFVGYYSAYDHVVFCWLFGKMIDLPKGFPFYTIDLKQKYDELEKCLKKYKRSCPNFIDYFQQNFDSLKSSQDYPKNTKEHSALSDAKFNKELDIFLTKKQNELLKLLFKNDLSSTDY